MSTALSILAVVLLLIVGVWLAVFGGIGALLAPRRGRTAVNGFLLGALLGPIGWAVVLLRPRAVIRGRNRQSGVGGADVDAVSISPTRADIDGGDDDLPIR